MSFDAERHQEYKDRVAKNADRIAYAIRLFSENNIEFVLKCAENGHFHCRRKRDDKLIQFWAGTGKILGFDSARGIHALIKILCEEE